MEESINHLVESLKETGRNPDVAAPQLALINTSKEFIQVIHPYFELKCYSPFLVIFFNSWCLAVDTGIPVNIFLCAILNFYVALSFLVNLF